LILIIAAENSSFMGSGKENMMATIRQIVGIAADVVTTVIPIWDLVNYIRISF